MLSISSSSLPIPRTGALAERLISLLLLLLFLSPSLHAQEATTVLHGRWLPPERSIGADTLERIEARITDISSGSTIQRSRVSADGTFEFRDVPTGSWQVELMINDNSFAVVYLSISSPLSRTITIRGDPADASTEVVEVHGDRFATERSRISSVTSFTAESIRALPAASPSKQIESMLLATPGVVPDEDGRLHVRGEDAQIQYRINGIPITGNMTRVYGSLLDASMIRNARVITGGLDPEFGVASSAVVLINTRSGFDAPSFVDASATSGSFGTLGGSVSLGGNVGDASLFLHGSATRSDRYLDPVGTFMPMHDHGEDVHLFGSADLIIGERYDVDLLGSWNRTRYHVPDRYDALVQLGPTQVSLQQDQRHELGDWMAGMHATAEFGDARVGLLLYHRTATDHATSSGLSRITTAEERARAIRDNEQYFIGADRNDAATGGSAQLSIRETDWLGLAHEIGAGIAAESYPICEYLSFAITDSNLADPTIPGGDARLRALDLTHGGIPFLVDTSATGSSIAAWNPGPLRRRRVARRVWFALRPFRSSLARGRPFAPDQCRISARLECDAPGLLQSDRDARAPGEYPRVELGRGAIPFR